MEVKRDHIIRAITYSDEIHVFTTIPETNEKKEIFMRIIFVMGNTLRPSFMDSYPFRLKCRNYCYEHNIPIAFTCFNCMEMQAALHTSKIPINELKNGEIITVIAKIVSTQRDIVSSIPMRYDNNEFQILPNFLYFNPDLKSKEFQEDFLKTKLLNSKYYIIVYPDEESTNRYQKVFNSLNSVFIERWDKTMTTKVDMEVTLHKLGLQKADFSVNYCPVVFKAVYGDEILFSSEEKFPMKKSCEINVDSKKIVKHEIHQKGWNVVIFTREISLKSFISPKATVTMEIDKNLCFKFDVQQIT
uniref:Uncharacterized protein n=1 Tax=Panagrolaimus sp. PS1159 TaxID=55785 RepID=A0AC35GIP8_9BILA